jgi:hypothetical protein
VRTGALRTEAYDAVVVASGHYSTTYTPNVAGIRAFDVAHPGVLSHAKTYRGPDDANPHDQTKRYAGRKVLIVGNGPSGLDIAGQIARVAQHPVLVSAQSPTPPESPAQPADGVEEVGQIAEFVPARRGVRLADGREVDDVDAVLFCTGYLFSFSFLEGAGLEPSPVTDNPYNSSSSSSSSSSNNNNGETEKEKGSAKDNEDSQSGGSGGGRRVHGLYQHFLHIAHPTLAFPGLPIKVIPFPVAEAQAAVFARAWANALTLPSRDAMAAWERGVLAERGGARFHVFPKGGDGAYVNALHGWVRRADRDGAMVTGKTPPWWDDEMKWRRAIYAEAKAAFERAGKTARSLEELGFAFPGSQREGGPAAGSRVGAA